MIGTTFKSLIDGKEKSLKIILQDAVNQSGRSLLKALLNQGSNKVDSVHVVLNEITQDEFSRGLTPAISQRITYHDCSQDPLGWDGKQELTLERDLCQRIHGNIPTNHSKVVVVLDSLSHMICHRSVAYTCRTINKLTDYTTHADVEVSVIALLHGDLHDDLTLNLLKHSATSVLKVEPPKQNDFSLLCNVLHKKPSGKVINGRAHVSLLQDFTVDAITEYKPIIAAEETSAAPDPAANLTFNLTLNEKAKEARSNLQLPYMHQQPPNQVPSVTMGSGKIFYQPDDADDFDEEDPDDDLDI